MTFEDWCAKEFPQVDLTWYNIDPKSAAWIDFARKAFEAGKKSVEND